MLSKLLHLWKSQGAANRQAKDNIQAVLALPLEEVKRRALNLISDTRRFRTVVGTSSSALAIAKLGPETQDFFLRFDNVSEVNGEFHVAREFVAESSLRPGFLKIGNDFERSELFVKPVTTESSS